MKELCYLLFVAAVGTALGVSLLLYGPAYDLKPKAVRGASCVSAVQVAERYAIRYVSSTGQVVTLMSASRVVRRAHRVRSVYATIVVGRVHAGGWTNGIGPGWQWRFDVRGCNVIAAGQTR